MAPGSSQSSALEENDPEPGLSLPSPTVFSRGRRLDQADEQDEGAQNDNAGPARRRRDEKRPMRRPKRTTEMVFDKNGRQIGHRLL